MEQKVMFNETVTLGDQTYNAGLVYTVNPELREQLVKDGKVSICDFAKLDSVELAIEYAVNAHKQAKEKLLNAPQYKDAESLRQHEIKLLEDKLAVDVAKLKEDYFKELELAELDLAKQALAVDYKLDEGTLNMLDAVTTKMQYAVNPTLELKLLALKVKAMDTKQQMTVLQRLPQIEQTVANVAKSSPEAKEYLATIKSTVQGVTQTAEIDTKLRMLDVIKRDYANAVDLPYTMYKGVGRRK
jgi:hypothetical protein